MNKGKVFSTTFLNNVRKGDHDAFRELFEQYYVPLCLYSVQITGQAEVTEDIVQDFFLHFWEGGFYKHIGTDIKPYLYNAIRNPSINYIKKQHMYIFQEVEESMAVFIDEAVEESVIESRHRLTEAWAGLSPREAHILKELIVKGKSYKAVASELGISVNTVKTHLLRAMRHLRYRMLLFLYL